MRGRAWLFAVALLFLAGCGDKTIALTYTPGSPAPPLTGARAVTVFAFRDARGDEGDGNPYRVGGIYGGYGNRLSKVWSSSQGVAAQAAADREFQPGDPTVTGYALGGDLKNFSTEARYTNSAHISGIVRLYESNGTIAVEKEISQRVLTSVDDLQRIMNDALSQFVQRVVTDADIAARLVGDKRPE
jgi:uncharacterized lipoprotein YmbA